LRLLYKEDEEGLILLQDTIKKIQCNGNDNDNSNSNSKGNGNCNGNGNSKEIAIAIAMVKLLTNVIAINQNIQFKKKI
jgi:hypothetical protein